MAPKKKAPKKGNDDWEADLGESPDPIAAATKEAQVDDATQDAEEEGGSGGGGGLLAALKKNKTKKQKKGKPVENNYVDDEDINEANGLNGHAEVDGPVDLDTKTAEEATVDDLFAAQTTKGKGGKGKQGKSDGPAKPDEGSGDEAGGLKSKKEKEKDKKERQKQKKREQVLPYMLTGMPKLISRNLKYIGRQEKDTSVDTRTQGGSKPAS